MHPKAPTEHPLAPSTQTAPCPSGQLGTPGCYPVVPIPATRSPSALPVLLGWPQGLTDAHPTRPRTQWAPPVCARTEDPAPSPPSIPSKGEPGSAPYRGLWDPKSKHRTLPPFLPPARLCRSRCPRYLCSAQLGTARLASPRLGSAPLGPARPGSARPGSAPLGTARLGTLQPSPAGLGSVQRDKRTRPPAPPRPPGQAVSQRGGTGTGSRRTDPSKTLRGRCGGCGVTDPRSRHLPGCARPSPSRPGSARLCLGAPGCITPPGRHRHRHRDEDQNQDQDRAWDWAGLGDHGWGQPGAGGAPSCRPSIRAGGHPAERRSCVAARLAANGIKK